MKKIFTILALIILSSCAFKDNSKYGTSTLLKTEHYEYKINYPKDWFFWAGSTDATRIFLKDYNRYIESIATITRQPPKNRNKEDIGGSIEIYLFDKDDKIYQDWIKNLSDPNRKFIFISKDFSNPKDKKVCIPYNALDKWHNDNKGYSLSVVLTIDENKAIIFDFYGERWSEKGREKAGKEFYKIINSVRREKINKSE